MSGAGASGQVLVLFVLFLFVLLGCSALAIDYASWLLTDRTLQNVSDHASLAGASAFDSRQTQGSCSGGLGAAACVTGRQQAWKSVSNDLDLNLTDAAIAALAASDSPTGGQASGTYGGQAITFKETIWVSTPPPTYQAYTSVGGRYRLNYGVVFVRVDRAVPGFLSGAIGVRPQVRTGWSTAGALPTDFALETFCRNGISPQNGVCPNSAGVTIDGQGGIRLLRGDIGSNESLTVTANTGSGVIVESGNVFVVNRACASSTWNCPVIPATTGGISDGDPNAVPNTANNKSAFYMAPLPVPEYASPLNSSGAGVADNTVKDRNCSGASASALCVPYRPFSSSITSPGDWTCVTSGSTNRCGSPSTSTDAFGNSRVTCAAANGGTPNAHLLPKSEGSGNNSFTGSPAVTNGNLWTLIDDNPEATPPDADTVAPPAATPMDWIYSGNLNTSGGGSNATLTVNIEPPFGVPQSGSTTVRYVVFKTNSGVIDNTMNGVSVQVSLLQNGINISTDPTTRTLTGTPTRYEWTVGNITDYNSLSLRFLFQNTGASNNNADKRGGAVSWAEAQTPQVDPALPPMIPPGYYRSIDIPDGGCAILDPTAVYSGLKAYQMPGIYRFGSSVGANNTHKIKLGTGAYLIGDGVTFIFDGDWPASGSNQGIALASGSALVLNTMRVIGVPTCTPSETETLTVNDSAPLSNLPMSAVCAAWGVDHNSSAAIVPGRNAWSYCDPANVANAQCVNRSSYAPSSGYRGITFYFTPTNNAWPPSSIPSSRFDMSGGSNNTPGIAFRGVLYAPYDDVKITGSNGFRTVGQVLSWSAKFNGGSAYIDLDYPFDFTPASPYLLEPTISH
jgi:hypothetical protein